MQQWIPAEIDVDLRVRGAFRIGMRRLSGGTPVYVRPLSRSPSANKLTYTWRWENAFEDMPQTRVTVQFTNSGRATELLFIHENLPEIPICLQHRSGWIAAWDRLDCTLMR